MLIGRRVLVCNVVVVFGLFFCRLYTFSRNIVGHAAVGLDALTTTAAGNLTLRHCENINTTLGASQAYCLALAHLPDQPDTYILPAGLRGNAGYDNFDFVWTIPHTPL